MKKWKQVLAVIGTAALLLGNLASVSQPVFADADSDGTKTEAVSSNEEGDGSSDNEAEQESAADENAALSSAEDSGENSSDNSTEDAGAAADDAQSADEQTSSDNAGAEDQKIEDQGTDSDAKSDDETQNADQKEETSDQNDQENAQDSNSGAAVTDEDAAASDSAATEAESAVTLTTEDTAVTADTEAVTVDGEEAMPARIFDPIETDNFVVKISIGEGAFKEDVNPLVVELSDEQAMEVAEKAVADDEDTTVKAAAGVDVTFTDEFGQKTQPAEDGKVDITLKRKTPLLTDEEASSDDIDYQIVHEHEDEIADTQTEDVDANGGSISVDSLSPIVLAAMQKSPAANEPITIDYDPIKPSVPEDWSHSKSKTATNLNKNYDSTVTLAVPSSEVPISSDVVFVLDKSTSADVRGPLKDALQSLQQQIKGTDATVKVGVVVFNKRANETLRLTELKEENQSKIDSAIDTEIASGTNLHAGILAGTKMLDADTTVAADHKYLVVVSDGITYMYGEEPTSIISEQWDGNNVIYDVGNDSWKIKYGDYGSNVPSNTEEWNEYLGTVQAEVERDDDKYDLPYKDAKAEAEKKPFTTDKVIRDDNNKMMHAMCVDKALYKSYEAYEKARSEGYHTFALMAGANNKENMNLYSWGPSFIKYLNNLNNEKAIDFSQIMKEIYYVVDQGSSIEDSIGSGTDDKGNSYDFSFVNDLEKIDFTLGGQKLDKEKITDNKYGFGKESSPAADSPDYKFVLTYNPDQDAFKVDINVPITLKDTLQISYDVHLTNPQEKAGTYGQYDQDGSKGYQALYTNNEAVLHPVDSNRYQLKDEYFPKPTVSYTVDEKGEITPEPEPEPMPEPEPEPEPMPEPEPESTPSHHNNGGGDDHGDNEGYGTVRLYKVDAQTGAKLTGAVFSLYKSDGEFVGSYTTDGDGAITVSSIPYSTYYFKETKAPDGYTLDPTYVRFYLKTSEMNLKFSNTAATVPTVMVGGTKTWVDNDNAAGMRPSAITLHLFANGVEVGTTQASADTNWTYSFGAQPANGTDGKPIAYTMTEDTADSYTSAISNPVASNDQIVINVTNTYQGVLAAERGNGTEAGSAGHAGVATGDNSQMAMYGILFLIAGAGFAGMLVRRKFN